MSGAEEDANNSTTGLPVTSIRRVNGSRVNLRMGPGTDFGVVSSLTRDTAVEILSDDGTGWVELRDIETGLTGWMADRLLTPAN